jgi:acyl-CoA thioesterase I
MRILVLFLLLSAGWLAGCGQPDSDAPAGSAPPAGADEAESTLVRPDASQGSLETSTTGTPPPAEPEDPPLTVLFLGTSLTEGYGLGRPELESWPARVGALADSAGIRVRVVNAGLSGETSAGALRRVDWVLQQPVDVLVVETGANDGLRALSVADLESNLEAIVDRARALAPGARIALVEMEAPPNLGPQYVEAFREVYRAVAERTGVTLVGFPLDGVAGERTWNQADGIHPTAEGHDRMARNAWSDLEPLLRRTTPP